MLIWVNHINRATNRPSVVTNSNGWWTAHVVVELECCNAENAVMRGSGMMAGDKAEVERGGDTFQQKYQHIALLVVIVLYLKQSNSLVVLAKLCCEGTGTDWAISRVGQ